jgi:hypothetical protein
VPDQTLKQLRSTACFFPREFDFYKFEYSVQERITVYRGLYADEIRVIKLCTPSRVWVRPVRCKLEIVSLKDFNLTSYSGWTKGHVCQLWFGIYQLYGVVHQLPLKLVLALSSVS